MVTFFVLLSEEKISKNKNKKSKNRKKLQRKNTEKRGAKVEQYLEEHIEGAIWAVFACADFCLVPNHIIAVRITWYISYLERE